MRDWLRLGVGEVVLGVWTCLDDEDLQGGIGICETAGNEAAGGSSCSGRVSKWQRAEGTVCIPPAKMMSNSGMPGCPEAEASREEATVEA